MGKEKDIEFGNRLFNLRKKTNLTQNELAKIAGVTRQTIHNYETGESKPKIKIALKLAKAFNVDVNYLFNGTIEHISLSKLTYKDIVLSYLTLYESCLFEETITTDEDDNKVFTISTTDQDFISFTTQLKSILSIEGSLSTNTLNHAIKELLDSFEISVLTKFKDQ